MRPPKLERKRGRDASRVSKIGRLTLNKLRSNALTRLFRPSFAPSSVNLPKPPRDSKEVPPGCPG